MEWIIQKNRIGTGAQELQVSILVQELKQTWAHDAESWESNFKDKLKEIPRKNIFSAEYGYKAIIINRTSLEVWKMKANGDFNYKMFTVTKQSNDKN